jgi:hypothetical protein
MKFKELYLLSFAAYAVSFLIPAYEGSSFSFCCGGTETWYGWKCFIGSFALFYEPGSLPLALFLIAPNVYMVSSVFLRKLKGPAILFAILLLNFASCSFWFLMAISKGDFTNLLPGYWLWFISIMGNNVLLQLNKRKRNSI